MKEYVPCEKAKMDGDKLLGQKPRFEVRTEKNNRSENSFHHWKQGAHRQYHEALTVQENKMVNQYQSQKRSHVDIVTIIIWGDECQRFNSIDDRKKTTQKKLW